MQIANVKLPFKPYSIIFYVLLVTGLLAIPVKMVTDILRKMNFENNSMNTAASLLLKENMSPSVVELFTSEGCSSCPSADKLFAEAQNEFNESTIVLTYHVDYWDRLGWKDRFSNSIYSNRQRQYAQHFNLESIYTPQAIVNGKTEFVGSNKSALWNAISNYKSLSNIVIETEIDLVNDKQFSLKYNYPDLHTNEQVVFALILKNASTQVLRGENRGAILSHINIVQDLVQKNESKGIATFSLPNNFTKENYFVVAFIQNNRSLEITNAKKVKII